PKLMPAPSKDDFRPGNLKTALMVNPTSNAVTVSRLGILRIRQSSQPAHPAKLRAPAEITASFHQPLSIARSPFFRLTALPRGERHHHENSGWPSPPGAESS